MSNLTEIAKENGAELVESRSTKDTAALIMSTSELQATVEPVAWRRWEVDHWVYYETKEWDDLTPLFAHAIPKSEGKPEPDAEIIRGKLYPWKNKSIPYMAKVYFDTSLATPQPTTDISELIAAMNEVIRISDRDHDAWNRVKALIAKHTVKA